MDHLTGRMGSVPILSVKQSVSIGTMINFDGDEDGHGDGDGTCKQTLPFKCFIQRELYNDHDEFNGLVSSCRTGH